jgi:hypothetical protein
MGFLRLLFLICCWPALPALGETPVSGRIYVSSRIWSDVIEIDTVTLERQLISLYDYPRIIKATDMVVEPEGTFLIETVTAVQQLGLYRVNPRSGERIPASGYHDGYSTETIGQGPPFQPQPNRLVMGAPGQAFVLRQFQGPMEVDLATGDRRIVSQSEDPVVGKGPAFIRPIDLVALSPATLLVLEGNEGIMKVNVRTGDRTLAWSAADLGTTPRHIELLHDGRIAFTVEELEVGAVFALDPATSRTTVLSGSFGGIDAGKGEAIHTAGDFVAAADGYLYLLDLFGPVVLRIDPETGTRVVMASPEVGTGVPLFSSDEGPTIAATRRGLTLPGTGWFVY